MNCTPGFSKSFAWSSLLWIGACAGAAQTHPASPAGAPAIISPTVQAPAQEGSAVPAEVPARRQTNSTSRDRLFFALPNFLTLEKSARVRPIPAAQKFQVTARSAFDPFEYFWYGALSGISQGGDTERGYGQGGLAYAKRYGAYFADGTIENFLVSAALPSLLHQDPRYFQMGEGGFRRRMAYAITRTVVKRPDNGHNEFNFSEILGSAASAALSTNLYHPVGDRTLPNTLSVWGSQIGYDTLTLVVKEFWPDLRRKIHLTKN
jgi:hypothetical protein